MDMKRVILLFGNTSIITDMFNSASKTFEVTISNFSSISLFFYVNVMKRFCRKINSCGRKFY